MGNQTSLTDRPLADQRFVTDALTWLLDARGKPYTPQSLDRLLAWTAANYSDLTSDDVFSAAVWDVIGADLWNLATEGDVTAAALLPPWRAVIEALKEQDRGVVSPSPTAARADAAEAPFPAARHSRAELEEPGPAAARADVAEAPLPAVRRSRAGRGTPVAVDSPEAPPVAYSRARQGAPRLVRPADSPEPGAAPRDRASSVSPPPAAVRGACGTAGGTNIPQRSAVAWARFVPPQDTAEGDSLQSPDPGLLGMEQGFSMVPVRASSPEGLVEGLGSAPATAVGVDWARLRAQALEAGEYAIAERIVVPVTYPPNQHPQWEGFPFDMIKELRRGVLDCGLDSPFTKSMLGTVMNSYTLVPHDLKALANLILSSSQYSLWEAEWKRFLRARLQLYQASGDSQKAALTLNHLAGEGDFARASAQARALPRVVLDEIREDAYRAFLSVPDADRPQKSFVDIRQGAKENYMQFVDRLKDALDKQISQQEAREFLLLKLAVENANADCQRVLRPLENPTLVQMLQACNRIGTIEHKYEAMAAAFADLSPASVCYKCGGAGHFRKECRAGAAPPAFPKACPRCHKGRHFANQCRSRYDERGNPLQGKASRSAKRRRAGTKVPPAATAAFPTSAPALPAERGVTWPPQPPAAAALCQTCARRLPEAPSHACVAPPLATQELTWQPPTQ